LLWWTGGTGERGCLILVGTIGGILCGFPISESIEALLPAPSIGSVPLPTKTHPALPLTGLWAGMFARKSLRARFLAVLRVAVAVVDRASHHDGPPHLIETTAFPLASHSRHRSRGAKSTTRSFSPSPSDGRAAGWISPSCPQDAHSTITKSPGLRSLTRAE
jgi:hypothetical protein